MVSKGSMSSGPEAGYNLVVLVVAITLLHIALAVAMPLWSTAAKREREEEAIFRGMQYAEGLRVFRDRFGRYPTELKELIELEPRSIRRLWTDPLSENEETSFGLLMEVRGQPIRGRQVGPSARGRGRGRDGRNVRGRAPNQVPLEQSVRPIRTGGRLPSLVKVPPLAPGKRERRLQARGVTTGPIRGVYIANEGSAIKMFQDTLTYEDWAFTDKVIPIPDLLNGVLPVVRSDWIGRPFSINPQAVAKQSEDERRPRATRGQSKGRNRGSANRARPGRATSRNRNPGRRSP